MAKQAFLEWTPKGSTSRALLFDVVTRETLTLSATVSSFPTEVGSEFADHYSKDPKTLALTVVVSNQPIESRSRGGEVKALELPVSYYEPPIVGLSSALDAAGDAIGNAIFGPSKPPGALTMQFSNPFDAIAETLAEFEQIRDSAQLLTVVLPSTVLENMALVGVAQNREAGRGGRATLDLQFQEIRRVEVQLVTAPKPSIPRGLKKKPAEKKESTALEKVLTGKASVLQGGSDFAANLIRKAFNI